MLDAGLIPLIVVNQYTADFWKQIFPKITVHGDVAVRTGGEIAWAIRKNSPQLKAALDDFARRNKVGTSIGNQLLKRYLKDVKYVKNAASEEERKKFQDLDRVLQEVRRPVRRGLGADGGAGLPGVATRPEREEPRGGDRRHAADARHGQGNECRRRHEDGGQHQRRHQVHALHDRPLLRQRADDEPGQGPVRIRLVQRGTRARAQVPRRRPSSAASTPTCGSTTSSTWPPTGSARKP